MNQENKNLKQFIVKTICRDDLLEYLSKEQIEKLDDDDMNTLADKIGDSLSEPYWISIKTLVDECDIFKSLN